ncbi:FKBP-type peptidyl-prolyl cis-trans isomerase [Luteimonas dalianensis]|uniref:FKBP-type peptidyl-prolyl cis-trans isomerase n=1 Tax=Luteimonas dalianensis TaxID=1148196 RepID=UPI003BF154E3
MSIAAVRNCCLALLVALLVAGCADPGPPPGGSVAGLERIDTVQGDGEIAQAGDEVVVHYSGWVYDEREPDLRGEAFDSSRERDEPFSFPLGAGRVIAGWDEGVTGMRVGGRRELRIPSEMAYGRRGAGGVIPPNASLVFDVELLEVRKP